MDALRIAAFLLFAILLFGCVQTPPAVSGSAANGTAIPVPQATAGVMASPYEGGLTFEGFEAYLEVGGKKLVFKETERKKLANQDTPYGLADLTVIRSQAGGITRETKIWAVKAFNYTYLIQHAYSSNEPFEVARSGAFSATIHDAAGARLYYGPADGTTFMEDYANLPAAGGYSKRGGMLYGGVPLNYAWNKKGGVAVGVLAAEAGTYELPLNVSENRIGLAVTYAPKKELKQESKFKKFETEVVFVTFNKGDYFRPLDRYTKLLEKISGKKIRDAAPPQWAKKPYWKTWGLNSFEPDLLSKEEIRTKAKELKELGIEWIMLDWGWFADEGDWSANKEVFESDADLEAFLKELKKDGFRLGLWFQPLQINPENEFVRANLLKYAVHNRDGSLFIDDDGLALLNPAAPEVQEYVQKQFERFARLGVDHVYLDSQIAQVYSPPDYPRPNPLDSHEALAGLYETMWESAEKTGMVTEICPDGRSQTILNMPQHINNVGDPKNYRQMRAKFKSLKAILGSRALIGAYVEDPFENDLDNYRRQNPESFSNKEQVSFASIIGLGGQLQTYFRSVGDFGKENWKKWLGFYSKHGLVDGDYLDLYDLAFDYPEGHAVRKGNAHYYSFFTQTDALDACLKDYCEPSRLEEGKPRRYEGRIELRGLQPNKEHRVERFPEGVMLKSSTDAEGRIVLENEAFDKEVVFIVTPDAGLPVGGLEKRADGATRLTNCYPQSCQNPVFSPDGAEIMFTRFLNGYNNGPSELVVLNLRTGREKTIVGADGSDNVNVPFGSWVGGKITFASDRTGTEELFVATSEGKNIRQVTKHEDAGSVYIEPVFNPKNTDEIVFEVDEGSKHKLALADAAENKVVSLTTGEFDDRLPSWSPDEKKILWQRNVGEDDWRVYSADIELNVLENVEERSSGPDDTDNSWTYDGRILSSRSGDGSAPNIFVLEGGEWKRMTSSEKEDGAPSASPDGKKVAFESHVGGEESASEIWVIVLK